MYAILKRWYWNVSARAPNPSQTDMENVRGYFQTLYQREETHPPGLPLATNINPAKVNDKIPLEAEVGEEVQRLLPHSMGGHTHLRTDHFKQWRREAYPG